MIDAWFPTLIYFNTLDRHKEKNALYASRAYEIKEKYPATHDWNCNTYSSMGSYDLSNDSLFKELIDDCVQEVYNYSREYGEFEIHLQDCWINIAEQGNYQEYHIHPSRHFSLVYYVKVPKNCGRIMFKSFSSDFDMYPLPYPNKNLSPNFKTIYYPPEESRILIFRSNLQHMVEANNSSEDRISIAMNFWVK
jgi:uncharacterized protein (TIGR02466 family)